jgi:hypothetical protein
MTIPGVHQCKTTCCSNHKVRWRIRQVATQCSCHHYLFSPSLHSKIFNHIIDVITIRLRHSQNVPSAITLSPRGSFKVVNWMQRLNAQLRIPLINWGIIILFNWQQSANAHCPISSSPSGSSTLLNCKHFENKNKSIFLTAG